MGGGPHLPGEGESALNGMVQYSHYSSIPLFQSLPVVQNEANVRQDKLGKEDAHG